MSVLFSALCILCCCLPLCLAQITNFTTTSAVADIQEYAPSILRDIQGTVTFTQASIGAPVTVHVYVRGLAPGPHGLHVHKSGDLSRGCLSTGEHFNPHEEMHGAPNDTVRHVGDLGNIVADDNGLADVTFTDSVISLSGEYSIVGRGLVINHGEDDLGRGENTESTQTGGAGGRIACGVIVPEFAIAGGSSAIVQWSRWAVVVAIVATVFI